jgi:Ca-activated chloride channel homolog
VKKIFFLLFLLNAAVLCAQPLTRILFILDASNSMNQDWDGQTRIVAAKELLNQSIEKLRGIPDLEIALRVYGHQSPVTNTYQDCADTKLEVAFGKNNIDAIKFKVRSITARGATPIARTLEASASDFPDTNARNFIILITDGLESCDNDPCVIARKLRNKGVKVTPFVVGLGMDLSYLDKFNCIGTYLDAENKESFRKAIETVISKTLLNTTAQINLNDSYKKPTETDVTLFLYETGTQNLRYTLTHTMNKYRLPDTLFLDPQYKYDIVVNTLPLVEKKNVSLIKYTHNTIPIDCPQGFIQLTSRSNALSNLTMRVSQKDENKTLNHQPLKSKVKYLVGTYDIEVFTLPRTYTQVTVEQGKTAVVEIVAHGVMNYEAPKGLVGQIFVDKGNNVFEWVCNLEDDARTGSWNLQPGTYKLVYREKAKQATNHTREKTFKIESNKTISLNL